MPITDCEVRDPRIRRTRKLLQGALRTLLLTRSFEEISVQEIAEAATVNRATFYDHYNDKFALLDALIAGGFHQMLNERNVEYKTQSPEAARVLIKTVCDYLVAMHEGVGCKGQSPFEPLIDAAIIGAIRTVLVRGLTVDGITLPAIPAMVATAASAAMYAAAREWHNTPNRPTSREIAPFILEMVLPMLQLVPAPYGTLASEPAVVPA